MESFGAGLRREREQRRITLQDISRSTKISPRFLVALEEEHFDQLPGGVFNKGFVRAYARDLGIDEEQAIGDYLAASEANQIELTLDQAPKPEPQNREQKNEGLLARVSRGAFAVGLLLAAFGFAIGTFYNWDPPRPDWLRQGPPRQSPPHQDELRDGSSAKPTAPGTGESAKPAAPDVQPSNAKEPLAASSLASEQPAFAASTIEPATLLAKESSTVPNVWGSGSTSTPGTFSVLIKAREDSWMSIIADGKRIMYATLVASGEKSVEAHNWMMIRAGNVGALELSFNGERLPVQGDYAEVKTLTFDAHGLQQPVPKASSFVQPASVQQ